MSVTVKDRAVGDPAAPLASSDFALRRPWWRSEWFVDAVAVAGAAVVLTVVVFHTFSIPLDVPFNLSGDGYFAVAVTKTIHQTGGWMTDPRLGAPFGSRAFDFPSGTDNLNFVLLKGSTILFANPAVALNFFILACFTFTSVAGWLGARLLGLKRVTSIVLGLVFGFAPYHFQRAPQHVFLANYVAVPFGCVLAFWLLSDRPPFYDDARRTKRSPTLRGPRAWFAVAAIAVIGSGGIYYAAFTLLLVAVAMAVAALNREWRAVRSGEVIAGGIFAVIALNLAPSILYMVRHGHNPMVAPRSLSEIDTFGLHLVQLVSPVPGHRLAPLASLAHFLQPTEGSETGSWLGLVGVIGLVIAGVAVARRAVGVQRSGDDLAAKAGLFAGVCMVVGSVSGFAWLIGLVTMSEIRSWARVSIVIAFLALVAIGTTFDRVLDRMATVPWLAARRVVITSCAAAAVVLVAVADQAPRRIVADSRTNTAQWQITDSFVRSIEATLSPGAMVFQLPVVAHPEDEVRNRLLDYQLLDGFIHSEKLKWSFGGFEGREGDWQFIAERLPITSFLDAITATGFTGLYLDRFGYSDRSTEQQVVGAGVAITAVSGDQRRVFFDLRAYASAARARLGDAAWHQRGIDTLYPVTWWLTKGFSYGPQPANPMNTAVRMNTAAVVDLLSRGPRQRAPGGRRVTVQLEVRSAGGPGHLGVSGGGQSVVADVGPNWSTMDVPMTLTGERTTLHFAADSPLPGLGDRVEIRTIAVTDG